MNTDQINSLIRTVLKVLGTALATHGLTNAAGILNSEDFIGLVLLIVGVISSHSWHSAAPDSNGSGSGGKLGLFVALAAAGFLFTGCGTLTKYALVPTATIVQPATPASTNSAGVVTPAAPAVIVTNYAPNPTVQGALNTGAQYAPLAPAPWGWIASGVLALASAGLGLFAKSKNGQLNDAQSITQAVITGVEAANNADTKKAIQTAAAAAGVQGQLDPLVQSVTAQMK